MPRNKSPVLLLVRPQMGENIGAAARVALAGLPIGEADLRNAAPIDAQKVDLKLEA